MGCPSGLTSTASGSYKGSSSPTLPELNRSTSAVAMSSGRVGSEKDSDISVSRSCWLNCDTTIIPLDRDLFVHYLYSGHVAWSASHARHPHRLTSKNRCSRVAAGDATCVSSPTLQELISGLFQPVSWIPGRNKTSVSL